MTTTTDVAPAFSISTDSLNVCLHNHINYDNGICNCINYNYITY